MKARSKPVEVEFMRFDGDVDALKRFCGARGVELDYDGVADDSGKVEMKLPILHCGGKSYRLSPGAIILDSNGVDVRVLSGKAFDEKYEVIDDVE